MAVEFYEAQLHTPEGEAGRRMLTERGFDADAIERYSIGYSPDSWDALLTELRRHGFCRNTATLGRFAEAELAAAAEVQIKRVKYPRGSGDLAG